MCGKASRILPQSRLQPREYPVIASLCLPHVARRSRLRSSMMPGDVYLLRETALGIWQRRNPRYSKKRKKKKRGNLEIPGGDMGCVRNARVKACVLRVNVQNGLPLSLAQKIHSSVPYGTYPVGLHQYRGCGYISSLFWLP